MGLRRWYDRAAVYLAITALAASAFFAFERSGDFVRDDVLNWEVARSILERGSYEFNGQPETLYPPVLPLILTAVAFVFGPAQALMIRTMAVLGGLGLIAAYEFLRRVENRALAATACLLVGVSGPMFVLTTRWVVADIPFFLLSYTTLLVAVNLDRPESRRRPLQVALFAVCVVCTIMTRSAGVNLIGALPAWLLATSLADRARASRRVSCFLPGLLAGLVVLGIWAGWSSRRVYEWPVGSFPGGSYTFQVGFKSGPYPELGTATAKDVLERIERNLRERTAGLNELLQGQWVPAEWRLFLVTGPLLLVVLGLGASIADKGGALYDWFFLTHEAMYLLWPWPLESRFLLPTAPLACLYLWRGGRQLKCQVIARPRVVGALTAPVFLALAVWTARTPQGLQLKLSLLVWAVAAVVAIMLAGGWHPPFRLHVTRRIIAFGLAGVLALAVSRNVALQVELAKQNLAFDVNKQSFFPEIDAATWIRANTPPSAVIMARQLPVAYHYSGGRRTIWFPPMSNPEVLRDGIRRYHVNYVLVIDNRQDSYFLPPEEECFDGLLAAHPTMFRLVRRGPRHRIYEVMHSE